MHDPTKNLERLQDAGDKAKSVNFFIVGRHKNVSTGSIHGFGVVIKKEVAKGRRNRLPLRLWSR